MSINFKKINELIRNHPYYVKNKNMYHECRTKEDFLCYPIIGKKEARLIGELSSGDITTRTSGSSGEILEIKWDSFDYFKSNISIWKKRSLHGITPNDHYVTNHAMLYNLHMIPSHHRIITNKKSISLSKMHINDDILHGYVKHIEQVSPKWMMLQPSFAYALGAFLKKHSKKLLSVRLIELTGEYIDSDLIDLLQDFFPDVVLCNLYGAQEFNTIGYGDNSNVKLFKENIYLEIVDDKGGLITKEQTEGNIVITGLLNHAMPLIRYKLGDRGVWKKQNEIISISASRSNDSLITDTCSYDGSIFLFITEKLNTIFDNAILNFQYILEDNILYCSFFVAQKLDAKKVEFYLKKELDKRIEHVFKHVVVNFEWNNFITESRKIKYFINKDTLR